MDSDFENRGKDIKKSSTKVRPGPKLGLVYFSKYRELLPCKGFRIGLP